MILSTDTKYNIKIPLHIITLTMMRAVNDFNSAAQIIYMTINIIKYELTFNENPLILIWV